MNGHSTQFFNRQDLSPDELQTLQALSLTQYKDLYYGKGLRSASSKVVQRFESQPREAREENRREFEDISVNIDHVGRLHQVSGAITPASPIPEEDGDIMEEEGERRMSKEIFVTQSKSGNND